jgi:hypothetical protein
MINDGVAALQQQAADTRSRVLIAFWEFYMAMCESKKVVKAVRLKNAEAVLSLPGAWPLIQADVFLTRLNRDFCAYADAASGLPDSPRTATKSKSAKSRTGGKSRKSSR